MTPEEKPPPQRWWILALLFAAMTINILDRQVLSLVAPVLRDELRLSNTQYGSIVLSFLLGMTLGQIPVGMMMDRYGARAGFSVAVAWWSAANMLHAGARNAAQFSLLRFLLGVGECGTYSAGVKVIGQYFPAGARATRRPPGSLSRRPGPAGLRSAAWRGRCPVWARRWR